MPSVLGRYEVRAKIGEGGMAMVYVGCDPFAVGPSRVAALKILKDELTANRELVDMLTDEARIVARLSHPNVIKLYELGDERGRVFLAMELLMGQSLWEVWTALQEQKRRIGYDLAAWMGARICDGLHHAHEYKSDEGEPFLIVHRDVNPHNVFITYDGQIKIIDFGLAKAINRATKTAAGIVKGKLAYLSPEQATSLEIDRRADVFALGTTLWELTTNRRLFRRAEDIETLRAIYAAVVPDPRLLRPDYPTGLWTVLARGLARDRDERYPTALAFGRDLDAFAATSARRVDAEAMAAFLGELFPTDRERQLEWLRTASGPASTSLGPLKSPVAPDLPLPAPTWAPASPGESALRVASPVELMPQPVAPAPKHSLSPSAMPTLRRIPVSSLPPAPRSRAVLVALLALALLVVVGLVLLLTLSTTQR
jgi:serine/threonine protein kinase